MRDQESNTIRLRPLSGAKSGALAGIVSTLIFTIVHDILISDIWFSLLAMLVAGILCGVGLGVSFSIVAERPTRTAWVRFNLIFLALFVALAVTSELVYSPITSAAAVLASNEAPTELIRSAVPLIIGFVLFSTFVLSRIYARGYAGVLALLATILVLTLFLGMNVAIIGLVQFTVGSFYLVAGMFGLIAVLAAVFGATFLFLEREVFLKGNPELGPA